MGIASGMKELTRDIASSHEDRLKRLEEIQEGSKQVREAAQGLIKGFQASRKEVGAQQRKDLAQGKAGKKSEVEQLRADFRRNREELRAELREASAAWQGLSSAKAKKEKTKEV